VGSGQAQWSLAASSRNFETSPQKRLVKRTSQFNREPMSTKKFIIISFIASMGLLAWNAHFVFGSVFQMSSFSLTLPFSERDSVMFLGVGLIGLRWFFVHRTRPDNDET
jgi:hypothetical protein